MGVSRRQFLSSLAAGSAALTLPRWAQASKSPAPPRYIVQIMLSGGFDSILTVDPKDASKVGDHIDVGYRADERVPGKKRLYGPLMGALLRHESDLCLVHGVRADTVSHPHGLSMVCRGHIDYSPSTPLIGDVLGGILPGSAPIVNLNVGTFSTPFPISQRAYTSQTEIELPVLMHADRKPWSAAIEAMRAAQARRIFGDAKQRDEYLALNGRAAALSTLESDEPWPMHFPDGVLGDGLHLAIHALKTNQARFIYVSANIQTFDTHTDHFRQQTIQLKRAFEELATFIDALKRERNAFGPLWEQTTVAIGSELGRFPRLNTARGKDHWPENSWILLGRGIRKEDGGVTLGETDVTFRGVEVDPRTGSAQSGNRRPIFLDAIFATLVKIAGGDPSRFGYSSDAVLEYVLA